MAVALLDMHSELASAMNAGCLQWGLNECVEANCSLLHVDVVPTCSCLKWGEARQPRDP